VQKPFDGWYLIKRWDQLHQIGNTCSGIEKKGWTGDRGERNLDEGGSRTIIIGGSSGESRMSAGETKGASRNMQEVPWGGSPNIYLSTSQGGGDWDKRVLGGDER